MKILLSLLALLTTINYLSAQDTIMLKTGDELVGKVMKVDLVEVEYKKVDNAEGPSYTVLKKEVFMIKYMNGSKDVFNKPEEVKQDKWVSVGVAEDEAVQKRKRLEEEYDRNIERSRRSMTIGIVCTSIGVPFLVGGSALLAVGIPNLRMGYGIFPTADEYLGMTVAGGVLLAAGIPLSIAGPVKIGRSFKYKRLANETKIKLSFAPSVIPANGIAGEQTGLAMRITF